MKERAHPFVSHRLHEAVHHPGVPDIREVLRLTLRERLGSRPARHLQFPPAHVERVRHRLPYSARDAAARQPERHGELLAALQALILRDDVLQGSVHREVQADVRNDADDGRKPPFVQRPGALFLDDDPRRVRHGRVLLVLAVHLRGQAPADHVEWVRRGHGEDTRAGARGQSGHRSELRVRVALARSSQEPSLEGLVCEEL